MSGDENYFSENQEKEGAHLVINVQYIALPGSPKRQLYIGPWIAACHK